MGGASQPLALFTIELKNGRARDVVDVETGHGSRPLQAEASFKAAFKCVE